jgi:hypothetical protein
MKKEFRNFNDARKFVRNLEIKNQKEWSIYCKSNNKPDDIPTTPSRTYKEYWIGWGDWLGTGYVAHRNRKFRTFENCREFAYSLKLNVVKDWNQYCTTGNKPDDIPNNPQRTYKNKGWTSWGDFLGTGRVATHLIKYRTFEKARRFAHDLGLKNQKSWYVFAKSNKLPDNIPINPNQVYKDKGWISWGDFLDIGLKKYRTFEKARKFAQSLGLTGANEWRVFVKSGKLPKDMPANPNQVYKNKGWTNWGDWTGTNVIATYKIKYRNFTEAKEFAHSLGLKTANEWRVFVKSGKLPKDIPVNPWTTYSKKRKK